jgi:sensor histidine kinase YesM
MEQLSDIQNNQRIREFWISRRYKFRRHFLTLSILILVLYSLLTPYAEPYATYQKIVIFFFMVAIFYTNMYIMIPKLLFRNKYRAYAGVVAGYLVVCLIVGIFIRAQLRPYYMGVAPRVQEGWKSILFLFNIFLAIIASTGIKLFQRWLIDTARITELEKNTMQSELEQLKNQINPHFLFNMLNNANVLTQKDPEKASQLLMKLSDFLRYQLYDSVRPSVLLTSDIHFLEDFMNLEKVRRDNFQWIIEKKGDLSGVQIAPLLFIIFVENAAKYSLDAENKNYIHMRFEVTHNVLYFECVNSKPGVRHLGKHSGGLGLSNVRRRLQLLYPGTHVLEINDQPTEFTVKLKIDL